MSWTSLTSRRLASLSAPGPFMSTSPIVERSCIPTLRRTFRCSSTGEVYEVGNMKSPPPLTRFLAERKWKSYSGVLLSVIGSSSPSPQTHGQILYRISQNRPPRCLRRTPPRPGSGLAAWRGPARGLRSREAHHLAVLVYVYARGGRGGAQAGHGPHLPAQRVDKAGAHGGAHLPHGERPALRRTHEVRVRGDGEVRLRHAHRQVPEAVFLVGVELSGGPHVVRHAARAVDPGGDGLYLLPEARLLGVEEVELGGLFGGFGDGLGKLGGASAALGEVVGDGHPGPGSLGDLAYGGVLGVVVGREGVYRDHGRDAVQFNVLDLLSQVVRPGEDVARVLLKERGRHRASGDQLEPSRVGLEGAHGGDQDRRVGLEPRVAALDVKEAFGAHIRAETRLGYKEVSAPDPDLVRHDGGVARGDVAEGAGVDQDRRVLERLHQVRLYRLLQHHGHGAGGLQVFRGYRLAFHGAADHDPPEPPAQVPQRGGEGEDGHDLGGRGDVEAGLARHAVRPRPEADDDVAQGPVVDVEDPPPGDAVPVHAEEVVVLVDVVVDHGREQVVGRRYRVRVPCQVEVEHLHRHDLAVAAARRPALDPERRPHRRLAHGYRRRLADVGERLPEAHRRRGLPLP